jgi:predicted RNA methylase
MKSDKELYRQLRALPCDTLWNEEVARFDQATPEERMKRVAVIRAVGVVFSAFGSGKQKTAAKAWLIGLLQDPNEKVRRYAMAAIPKIHAGQGGEGEMLALLKKATGEREKKYLGKALNKIGGTATLRAVSEAPGLLPQTEQKVKASVARRDQPGMVRLDRVLERYERLRIHLRCRRGLEQLVRDEAQEHFGRRGAFRLLGVQSGYVAITPTAPFCLGDLYALRCFATAGFGLGFARQGPVDELAQVIASPQARDVMTAFTEGSLRYRIEFVGKGHQRGAVHQLAGRVYALCPDLLNDSRLAPWSVDIFSAPQGSLVELRPRLYPDPLAACMARLAGEAEGDVVWDPFCGSGLELIERAFRGGVRSLHGTDVSAEAIAVARSNVAAAKLKSVQATFACCDFRDHARVAGLGLQSVTLMITNPPMGRRLRIADMRGLMTDVFAVAGRVLKPGGRLVLVNPLRLEPRDRSLKLEYREVVDLGGFDSRLEMYRKLS